jgi:hypothetical protein
MGRYPALSIPRCLARKWYCHGESLLYSSKAVADDLRSTKTHKPNTLRSENQSLPSSKKLTLSSTSLPDPSTWINQSRKPASYSPSIHYPTIPDKLSWKSHLMFTLGSRLLLPNYQRMGKRAWCFLMLQMSLSLFWLLQRVCMRMYRGSLVCQLPQTIGSKLMLQSLRRATIPLPWLMVISP